MLDVGWKMVLGVTPGRWPGLSSSTPLVLGNGKVIHLKPWQIIEGAYHEAVHVAHGYSLHSSVEEECDAYIAERQAAVVIRKKPLPPAITLDNMRIADFVTTNYPGLPRSPQYRPVGESREWLINMAGLKP